MINGFLTDIGPLPAVLLSLGVGFGFTGGSLLFGQKYKLK